LSDWQPERYDDQLAQGLALSGEAASYFASERARLVAEACRRRGHTVRRLVELGCGTGNNLVFLRKAFPRAHIVGLDSSPQMVEAARAGMQALSIEVAETAGYVAPEGADLVFVNGVFHHVAPADRLAVLQQIHGLMVQGGLLAIFDNNPLNLGAMWVMRRIEFDRDARPLLAGTLAKLALDAGMRDIEIRTHFYFPRVLSPLRVFEPWLQRLPLGAQYVIYARRP
jgi:SAM-dependent methyltransferase